MMERLLVTHCAPTLAGLKSGSLFTAVLTNEAALREKVAQLNEGFIPHGLNLMILRIQEERALIYLYRERSVAASLANPEIWAFLQECGYQEPCISCVLSTLCDRLRKWEQFPHEIGIFLDYPLHDVIGFIRNEGRNCLLCGCWKCYENPGETARTFARYQKCKEVYMQRFADGFPLSKLTVGTELLYPVAS